MPKVTFIKNTKVDNQRYKIKESIEVDNEKYELLLKAEVINPVDNELFEGDGGESDEDLSLLSVDELQKIKNDDLKAFLTKKGIAFESKATKDELIIAIVGEEPTE